MGKTLKELKSEALKWAKENLLGKKIVKRSSTMIAEK